MISVSNIACLHSRATGVQSLRSRCHTVVAMEKPREKKVVYVGGLDENVTEEILHAAFIPFGDIVEVNIPKDFKENTNRGFGFVQYETEDDATAAMDNMDGAELLGRVLKCNLARPISHKLGNVKPVWSQDEWFKKHLSDDKDLADQMEFETLEPDATKRPVQGPSKPTRQAPQH